MMNEGSFGIHECFFLSNKRKDRGGYEENFSIDLVTTDIAEYEVRSFKAPMISADLPGYAGK